MIVRGGEVGCGGGLHQILTITEIKRFWSKPKILGTIHDLIKTFEILKTTFRIWIKTSDNFPFFFNFHLALTKNIEILTKSYEDLI